ncbi:hypothetical protein KHQ89_02075 [Mycoplasmatota bacterium]|nr:hypothetical protein KHQ89_02075 [Mycoplasmatota bacterium]
MILYRYSNYKPDDPEGTEGKGAVLNDKYIDGGVLAIYTWLEDNSPSFITVEPAEVDGYHRYFTLSYDFDDFDDFLDKYEQLVDLSPNLSWDDFDDSEKPSLEIEGGLTKTLTFSESKAIVEASLDWAIDGIWNDIYDEADLAGFVTKADIAVLAGYTVNIGEESIEELSYYDPDAEDGDSTGAMVYVESNEFELSGSFTNTGLIVGLSIAVVVVIGAGVFVFFKFKK